MPGAMDQQLLPLAAIRVPSCAALIVFVTPLSVKVADMIGDVGPPPIAFCQLGNERSRPLLRCRKENPT